MSNDDFVEKHESGETLEDASITDTVEKKEMVEIPADISHIVDSEKEDIHPLVTSVITVNYPADAIFPEAWASLEVEYSWHVSGLFFLFTCKTLRYRVAANGRKKGNIIFGFSSSSSWSDREISNDDAIQDGQWHTINAGGSVFGGNTARIYFKYIFDKAGTDFWSSVRRTLTFSLPKPTISNPGVVWIPRPTLHGTGFAGAIVRLYQSGVGTILFATAIVRSDNTWEATLTEPLWMADPFTLTASQSMNGVSSDWATPTSFAVLFKPVISNVAVSADGKPTVSGTGGLKDATLDIVFQGGSGGVQLTTTVQSGGSWQVTATAAWPPNTYTITARQIGESSKKSSNWADHKTFTVKPPKPAITAPPNPMPATQVLTITNVYSGPVTLNMFTETGSLVEGSFSTTGTSSTFTPKENWRPGAQRVKVVQTVNGIASDPSTPVTLTVKPPKPAITAPPNPMPATQVLTITNVYSGPVTLNMFTETGSLVEGSFSTTGTSSTFTPVADWAPGTRKVKVVQSTSNIESDPSDLVTLTVKPPKPAITPPPNPAPANQVLTITGVYSGAVTLKVMTEVGDWIPGNFTPTSGTTRTFTPAADWEPGSNKVKVMQTVGGVPSDPSDLSTLAVKPPKPAITPVSNPIEGKQPLTITGVYSGTVTLTVFTEEGAKILGTLTGTGTTRTFTPMANWEAGTYKVKVVQTVDGVASDPSDLSTLAVKPQRPMLTAPPNPTPADQVLTITGVYSNATLKMFTEANAEIPGTFTPSGTTRTFTPAADWEPGSNKVKVMQTVGGVPSDPSDLSTLAVKPPKPAITPVSNPIEGKQPLTITGVYSGTVTLTMFTEEGANILGTLTGTGTTRTFTPMANWAAGTYKVKVVQAVDGVASDPSDLSTLAVKPQRPMLTAPPNPTPADQVLTITGVYSDATLKMFTEANAEIPGTFTPSGTTRTFTSAADWAPGIQKVKVVQTLGGVTSDPSDLATLAVKPPKPEMTNPGVVRTALPTLHGKGVDDATVRLYQHGVGGVVLGTDIVKSDNTWTVTLTQPLPMADPFTMAASQTLNGLTSDWATTIDFAVLFKLVISPVTVSDDGKPTVSGTDGLQGATVEIHLQGGAGGAQLTTTALSGGTWSVSATEAWVPKTYTITARQIGNVTGQRSDWADNRTFTVKPPKPAITAPPNPAPADQVLTITGVYSDATLKMLTEADTEVDGTFATTGTTSTFTPTADWAPGPHRVKVVQTVNGVASDPSDECTFTVEVGDKPEAPRLELPLPGSKTSTYPLIRVTGQPLALMTVRREGMETLHSDTADDDGVLEFVATTPLVPGPNVLEVRQKGQGPESDWSEPHRFTVKELPRTPVIDAPTPGSHSPRKPRIRGKGETRGQILLRHENVPEHLIDTINGVTSWSWTAKELWDLGHYTIQALQTDDGDSSSWSEPRTFEVVDARYGIGDASPVLAQPGLSESVLLRVQVVSGVTGETVEGIKVEWRLAGEQAVMATTVTGPDGWAGYLYTPGTGGAHTVLADLTRENQGVEITQPFEVTALLGDA